MIELDKTKNKTSTFSFSLKKIIYQLCIYKTFSVCKKIIKINYNVLNSYK